MIVETTAYKALDGKLYATLKQAAAANVEHAHDEKLRKIADFVRANPLPDHPFDHEIVEWLMEHRKRILELLKE